jgi:hypothetical protein
MIEMRLAQIPLRNMQTALNSLNTIGQSFESGSWRIWAGIVPFSLHIPSPFNS